MAGALRAPLRKGRLFQSESRTSLFRSIICMTTSSDYLCRSRGSFYRREPTTTGVDSLSRSRHRDPLALESAIIGRLCVGIDGENVAGGKRRGLGECTLVSSAVAEESSDGGN